MGSESLVIYLKVFGILFLLIAILIGVLLVLKRFSPRVLGPMGKDKLKVLMTLSLGPKKSLVLVQFLNNLLLIGFSESNISLLKEVTLEDGQDFETIFKKKISSNNPSNT